MKVSFRCFQTQELWLCFVVVKQSHYIACTVCCFFTHQPVVHFVWPRVLIQCHFPTDVCATVSSEGPYLGLIVVKIPSIVTLKFSWYSPLMAVNC